MPFEIVRNDIVNMRVDAIVNPANRKPEIGSGTDTAIHEAAGPGLLLAREELGIIGDGDAAITPAFDLKAKYVIHVVCPHWRGGNMGEERLLRLCYTRALALAKKYKCKSVAFPLLCAGNKGYPKELALQVAVESFSEFCEKHDMNVYLVVFSQTAFRLAESNYQPVESFIDDHNVRERLEMEYAWDAGRFSRMPIRERQETTCKSLPEQIKLKKVIEQTDAGFSGTLLALIKETGKKNADIYRKAHISPAVFSRIKWTPDYKPKKETAIAFALALELDLEGTRKLLSRAGCMFLDQEPFDAIIIDHIRRREFNIVEIDFALFDQCGKTLIRGNE